MSASQAFAARPSVPVVLRQHAEDAELVRSMRTSLVRAPHVRLNRLRRLDDRLAAHLDGIVVAGDAGRSACLAAMDAPTSASLFVAAALAIERKDAAFLERVFAVCEAMPEAWPGMVSAFGWISAADLREIASRLLNSDDAFRRCVGLAACAMHEVDPGVRLEQALGDEKTALRAAVSAARLGRVDLLPVCLQALPSSSDMALLHTARACVLLGDRRAALGALEGLAKARGGLQSDSASLPLRALPLDAAMALLTDMARSGCTERMLVTAIGMAGDVRHVPALIARMSNPNLARVAGEAFSLLTGVDLELQDLDGVPPPEQPAAGDDPDDAMQEDAELPWPDSQKVGAWWSRNAHRFTAGLRYFVGAPPSPQQCVEVLRHGVQRQRIAAAEWICLLQPGARMFNVFAPAWRQQRRLLSPTPPQGKS